MNKLLFFSFIFIITLLSSCDKKDAAPNDYFMAIIDGKKFDAHYLGINRDTACNSITIHASSVNLLDENLPDDEILENPNFKFFEITFINDCLEERIFNWDEISADTSSIGFIYEFTDTIDYPQIKGFSSQMLHTDGYIEIEYLDNKKDGSIIGNFEVLGRNYNEIEFTDTIQISHGVFRFQFKK